MKCNNCNSENFKFFKKGPHTGAKCADCGKFIKWLNKKERNIYGLTEECITSTDESNECIVIDEDGKIL